MRLSLKRTLSFLTLAILLLLPLACAERTLNQPVSPAYAATPTPPTNQATASVSTPTATATP